MPFERLSKHDSFFDAVIEIIPRYRALFGRAATVHLDEVISIRNDIIVAARMLAHLRRRTHFGTQQQEDEYYAKVDEYERGIWSGMNAEDEIERRLAKATLGLESMVEGVLRSRFRPSEGVIRKLWRRLRARREPSAAD